MYLKLLKQTLFIFLTLLFSLNVSAQNTDYAEELLLKAVDYYQLNDFKRAKMNAVKAMSKDSLLADPYILLGNIYQDEENFKAAILTYTKGYNLNPDKFKSILINLAEIELRSEQFSQAKVHAQIILDDKKANAYDKSSAERIVKSAEFREQAFMNPIEMDKIKLKYVSHGTDEYINDISLDATRVLFTQKRKVDIDSNRFYFIENIYSAELRNDTLRNMRDFELPDEMKDKSGAASLSADGRYLFFTLCEEVANCELYLMSLKSPDRKVFNLGRNVNSIEWDSQPSFSSDGQTLYFASKREGGYGGSDIWFSTLKADGQFSRPQNAGAEINTAEDEMAPFIHSDNAHLYFSSNGHAGMGGYDLFVSLKDSTNKWAQAQNLGYPLNTIDDEINMIVAPDGVNAYMSAKAVDFDLYHFKLPEQHKASFVKNIIGRIMDVETNESLFASVHLYNLEKNEFFAKAHSFASNGIFNIPLTINTMFALSIQKEGYLFYSHNFYVSNLNEASDTIDVYLKPIKLNQKVALKNVFFETDSHALLDASIYELDLLIEFLNNNPSIKIEIGGHTDNTGNSDYNKTLSEKRARSVYDYLIVQGISGAKLIFRGYGETSPISSNDNNEGRAQNRRTEFKIVGLN